MGNPALQCNLLEVEDGGNFVFRTTPIMPNKQHILFANGHLNVGGVERSLVDVLKHLDYSKYDVDLLLLEDLGTYHNEIPKQVNVIYKDTRKTYGAFFTTCIHNIKTRNWFGLGYRFAMLATKLNLAIGYRLARRLLGLRKYYDAAIAYRVGICANIITHGVKSPNKHCWWHHGAIRSSDNLSQLTYFNQIIAVSHGVKKMLSQAAPTLTDKLSVVPNMVDVEQICAMGNDGGNPYSNYDGLKFVTVGRIVVEKHIENVVNAAVRLRADGRLNFKWFVIGDGELYDDIAQRIQEAQIEDCVILCGRKPNPYPYIKHADMMVHTSHIESQGLVIQEAMALGTPCVVTRSVGPSEFIIDGENGVMVEPNVESLIEGIYRLATDKKLQNKIIVNGYKSLHDYNPEVVINKINILINI